MARCDERAYRRYVTEEATQSRRDAPPGPQGGGIGVRLTVLGSGSAGNATLLQGPEQPVLIDVGLSYREVARRLDSVGVPPDSVGAVVITHAHGDHTRSAALFSRRHDVPLYTTAATKALLESTRVAKAAPVPNWRLLVCDAASEICGFRFTPFEVSHDAAAETLAFVIDTPDGTVGFATDVGTVTPVLRARFCDCRLLVIESNHAHDLLQVGPYPRSTKARIGGSRGHLSNESLALFVRHDLGRSVRCLVLAHLSRVNNVPEIAEMTCREALAASGRDEVRVVVSRQDRVAETVDLGAWTPRQRRGALGRQVALPF
ncbi:MAG: MBL fold metallo-hydrolase [Acidobacteria bacterium]|nr:MBL fold metallo-hydrolase [Acidobacteriota bacterium]